MKNSILTLATALGVIGLSSVASAQDFYPKETESFLVNYYVRAKEPTTATILSLVPGFGAGHFYAGQTGRGALMFAGEAVGLGLIVLGGRALDGDAGQIVSLTGTLIFTGFKIADIYLAPFSAEEHNKNIARQLKIKSLLTRAPPEPGGDRERLAYGLALEIPLGALALAP